MGVLDFLLLALLLVVVLGVLFYLSNGLNNVEKIGFGEENKKKIKKIKKKRTKPETMVVLTVKAPDGVRNMRRRYVSTDLSPPHVTLGTLRNDLTSEEMNKLIAYLRGLGSGTELSFKKWKHTKTFIALLPEEVDVLDKIVDPIRDLFAHGPRGGYHMSLAYRSKSQPLDPVAFTHAHEFVQTPFAAPIIEARISRKYPGESWETYKTISLKKY